MNAIRQTIAAVALAAGLAAAPALAQDGTAAADPLTKETVTLGVGAVYLPDYEGSNDYRVTAAPFGVGTVKGFAFQLLGNRLSVDLVPNTPGPTWDFQAGPVAVLNFDRTSRKQIDDDRVKALGKRDTALEVGGFVGIGKTGVITSAYDTLSVTLSYRHDETGDHDSGIWQPTIFYTTPLSTKAGVGLFATAEHVGRGYGRTYYSVTPLGTIASGLPTYTAGKGWKNWTLGALGTYALTGDLLGGWKLIGGGTYSRLQNEFARSPIVSIAGKRSQWIGSLGVAYTF
jgi:MipA family protein